MANLINNGILPLTFVSPSDYDRIDLFDELEMKNVHAQIASAVQGNPITIDNLSKGFSFSVNCTLSERQASILLAGGLF